MVPHTLNVAPDLWQDFLRITPSEGELLEFDQIQVIQYGRVGKNVNYCANQYWIEKTTYKTTNGVWNGVDINLVSSGVGLPKLKVSFNMIQDRVVQMKINNDAVKEYRPPNVVDDEYINDPEKKINIHIEDVLTLSEPGEPFYYEFHNNNKPNEVLYSTKGYNFVYTEFFKTETAWLNTTGLIFGLGERVGDFFLKPGVYTIWNKD